MTLPILSKIPKYKLKLPVSNIDITYRPFLVGEEKILLMAVQSGKTAEDYLEAFKQVIENCVVENIDIENLPIADIDHLFLQLRARSVGELISVHHRCTECDKVTPYDINIDKIDLENYDKNSNTINLEDNIYIVLRCPSLKDIKKYSDSKDEVSLSMDIILDCIDIIVSGEETINPKDYKREELESWVNGFSSKHFNMIKDYFNNLPKTRYNDTVTCKHCNHVDSINISGTRDFFTLLSPTQT